MGLRNVSTNGNNARVTLTREDLRADGLFKGDALPDELTISVNRAAERIYVVRIPDDDGTLPALEDSELVQEKAAKIAMRQHGIEPVQAD
jgi:hypothetical protein